MEAEDTPQSLILYLKSGTTVILPLSEAPSIKFKDDMLEVGNQKLLINNISKYTIANYNNSGLNGITFDSHISMRDNCIEIHGEKRMGNYHIYAASGIEINCRSFMDSECLKIDISGLNSGVYILSSEIDSIKFIKR